MADPKDEKAEEVKTTNVDPKDQEEIKDEDLDKASGGFGPSRFR